ncbi:unnamed protein product [Caenorhabditis sp. 36 PRJEB53466]|nr:unnamed protein product [Caenorhabditis sp. 36 PRJEB53466]
MSSLWTKWSNGQVNYYFDGVDVNRANIMRAGMAYISNYTCLRFVENSKADQRLLILTKGGSGCSSIIGAPGTRGSPYGEKTLQFGNCPVLGSAVHEVSHSLGSYHEHNRPDRDNFIVVNEAEVKRTGQQQNMNKETYIILYVPFEYGSVMMYDTHKYGPEIMKPKEENFERTMGNRRVSFYDIEKLNKYYECKCEKQLQCDNGGYTNPRDCSVCVCPKGFFGKLCNERPKIDSYELAASSEWQSTTIWFQYKFTGDNLAYFHSSFAYINAPNNKTIEIQLERLGELVCQNGCNQNGVEIKTREDRKAVSPIICCPDQEFANNVFSSKNNPTVIEMFSNREKNSVVGFSYRYV